jgi:enoyl-CoA hydratase
VAIRFEKDGMICSITIDNEESLNALDLDDLRALAEAWLRFRDDDGLLVAIVTGAGNKSFCAGANLKSLIPALTAAAAGGGSPDLELLHQAFIKKMDLWKPVIAAVNGYCFAGGVELLEATDIRVASEKAVFALPEPKWGLFPAGGSTIRLPRQIPYVWAMEILLTGGRISAGQAYAIGLLNRVVPPDEVLPEARKIAHAICENGPLAVKAVKESTLRCLSVSEEEAYRIEDEMFRKVFSSEDAREGPRAFAEKRRPVFTGR